jgi:endogenous inhibitor of DNA gyrase (YacG/DUF329 family)
VPVEKTPACPVCGKPTQHATRPFCSIRCRNVDLGRWMGGAYAIPAGPEDETDDETEG